jgi:type IV secretory pathway component VirB8
MVFDEAPQTSTVTNVAPQVVPVPTIVEVPLQGGSTQAVQKTESEEVTEIAADTVLTLEEQREVAFKVVAFFVMLILASFVLLFIYHRLS